MSNNIRKINIEDNSYPEILKEIHNPPRNLYIRGNFHSDDRAAIGVVGTRNHTNYGKQATQQIVQGLVKSGITIISGLAKGIDTIAHKTALQQGGRTIAVLGTAVDEKSVYPACNQKLANRISKQGAVISEHPLKTQPEKWFFAQRNRIISGLCLGVVVVEAPQKSGALITASQALEQNREVFAVPGPIHSPTSAGTNRLIQMGAKLVTKVNDILEELHLPPLKEVGKQFEPENKWEKIVMTAISKTPISVNEIANQNNLNTGIVNSTLISLELRGVIKKTDKGEYITNF